MKNFAPNEPLTGENATPEKMLYHLYIKPALDYAETLKIALEDLPKEADCPDIFYSIAICVKHYADMVALKAKHCHEAKKLLNKDSEDE